MKIHPLNIPGPFKPTDTDSAKTDTENNTEKSE